MKKHFLQHGQPFDGKKLKYQSRSWKALSVNNKWRIINKRFPFHVRCPSCLKEGRWQPQPLASLSLWDLCLPWNQEDTGVNLHPIGYSNVCETCFTSGLMPPGGISARLRGLPPGTRVLSFGINVEFWKQSTSVLCQRQAPSGWGPMDTNHGVGRVCQRWWYFPDPCRCSKLYFIGQTKVPGAFIGSFLQVYTICTVLERLGTIRAVMFHNVFPQQPFQLTGF